MRLHLGVMTQHFRSHASPGAIRDVAQAAERLGFDSVWVMDHVVIPDVPETRQFTTLVYDPLITLGYLAARTERVQLGTTVLIVPYRHPLVQASMLATLDALAGGRLIVGVGVGWLREEFEALGVPFERRGALTDEYLEAIQTLWSQDRAAFAGPTVRFANVVVEPKPVQRPRPPLWVGGSTAPALRRAARIGDVWHPTSQPPELIARRAARLRDYAERAGRDPAAIGIVMRAMLKVLPPADADTPRHSLIGTPDQIIAAVGAYRSAGVGGFVLDTFYGSRSTEDSTPGEVLVTLEAFAREVMPALQS
jgi:probable F420-dependent oxidoreductase